MKNTGITRATDDLGRIVIPKEIRDHFEIAPKDQLEIYTTDEGILLKKYQPSCMFCGSYDGIKIFKGKKVCKHCREEIKEDV
jgi:transcriptional pleiotropic regulator of transition state genes